MALTPWIRIGQPLEAVMEDYQRVFDAWEAGGIRGLVFGRLLFAGDDGNFTVPAFESSLEPYRARGLEVSRRDVACDPGKGTPPARHARGCKAPRLGADDLLPGLGNRGGGRPAPGRRIPTAPGMHGAVWEDVFGAFPEADGGIMDGWTESPYELLYHHGSAVFREMNESRKETAEARGWDGARLERGREHLHRRFRSFTRVPGPLLRRRRDPVGDEPLRHRRGRPLLAALAPRGRHSRRPGIPRASSKACRASCCSATVRARRCSRE